MRNVIRAAGDTARKTVIWTGIWGGRVVGAAGALAFVAGAVDGFVGAWATGGHAFHEIFGLPLADTVQQVTGLEGQVTEPDAALMVAAAGVGGLAVGYMAEGLDPGRPTERAA